MPNTQTVAADTPADDAALLEETLEMVSSRSEDLTPDVYARFFSRCPAASGLFTVIDPATPPMGCGQMLFEIISLLRDSAAGKPYVASYMQQIATEHAAFDVRDPALYREFMHSLADVQATLLGPDWSPAHAQAWDRQIAALLRHLPDS
ncbi:globin [Pseudomonas borbori]|uniref:Globin n=1 Tax=Pseudomonas borbori TaxID=289003 RepID=A0A1I5XDG1_9PSED|nr:globin [Pseudomonas borbori]SFQ29981.1 Globin [Pseudomonas borbori]